MKSSPIIPTDLVHDDEITDVVRTAGLASTLAAYVLTTALNTAMAAYVTITSLATTLAAYVQKTYYRAFFVDPAVIVTVYVETTGDDTTGDGSVGAPYATIQRAFKHFAILQLTAGIINVGVGTFDLPLVDSDFNNITIVGNKSIDSTRNITGVTRADETSIAVDIDGGVLTADQLYGKLVRYTVANRYGWVYYNNATSPNSRIFTGFDGSTTPTINTANDVEVYTLNTTLRLLGTLSQKNCTQFNVQDCNVTGDAQGRVWFTNASDKIQFTRCSMSINRFNPGSDSVMFMFNCFIADKGDATLGSITAAAGGRIRLGQGSILSSKNQLASNRTFIRAAQGSWVIFDKLLIVRGSGAKFLELEGSHVAVEGGLDANDVVYFETDSSVTSNAGRIAVNLNLEGQGGQVQLPMFRGATTATDFVAAKNFAKVTVPAGTSITTGNGTNTVSADGGATNVSSNAADETKIIGGSPA